MAYRTSESNCVVHIIPLRLSKVQEQQCESLRREAGRCWTDMVNAHIASRGGKWLTAVDLSKSTKNTYALHSQSVQALAQKLEANVDTARTLRQNGDAQSHYPYKSKPYQTVTWKESAIRRTNGKIILSNGRRAAPLILNLPDQYCPADICRTELTWRADHYELCLTIDTGEVNPPLSRRVKTCGVDLGEINIAAAVTDDGQGIVISGRALRSGKRLRNKRHAAYSARLAKCKSNSRRARKFKRQKARASAKFYRQQRDILHKASRQLVEFCKRENVARIAIGDVRDIANGVDLGRKSNQKISQWPHGQYVGYVQYKGRAYGMGLDRPAEDYSTRTCCYCGHVLNSAPRGRTWVCPGCGALVLRDPNGGANICSRARYGVYGRVQVKRVTYLRPIGRSRAATPAKVARSGENPMD